MLNTATLQKATFLVPAIDTYHNGAAITDTDIGLGLSLCLEAAGAAGRGVGCNAQGREEFIEARI